jgi:AraC-like DNA-binding protein
VPDGIGERRHKRTASAIALRPVFAYARDRKVDTDALLRELGIPASALDDPDYRIPEATYERGVDEAALQSRDPCFGLHMALHAGVGAYDVLDYALWCSATFADAIRRIAQFHRLLSDALALSLEVLGGVARIRPTAPGHSRQAAEALFALLVLRGRELTGKDLVPREVAFAHEAPPDTAPFATLFRCPVHFSAAAAEIVFEASDLDLPVKTAEPGLAAVLDRYMRELLARVPDAGSFVDRARQAVGETLRSGQRPSLKVTARALRASPRTVQRRLLDEGTTHRQVVDDVRRDLAMRLFDARETSVTEIAFLLGFSDGSGFRRTFKRWTGRPPARAHDA